MSIIRILSYQLLPYLPDLQFCGQLRELVAIMHDWRDKGTTNHLLVNKVMEYPKEDLWEGARDNISDSDIQSLQEALDEWCAEQSGTDTYYVDYTYKVRIPWELY